ncbi:transporter substrate-binding domain-containing protein [Shewanella sp. WXL01]|uniref:diguanylate cyclase n=1 Tax=Shewanella sp. WXL01 TaxID=2709721 RepID=UPI0014382BC2|nr:transporter substrate-binding domain-containing protein [Shewanella sp. WXL01]
MQKQGVLRLISTICCILALWCLSPLSAAEPSNTVLSEPEKEFILHNPVIKLGTGQATAPYLFFNAQNNAQGFDRDYADLIEQQTGFTIEFEVGSWGHVQNKVANGELHGLSNIAQSHINQSSYRYSEPYLSLPSVVVVNRMNHHGIFTIDEIQYKRVGVQQLHQDAELLTAELGDVDIVYFPDAYKMLHALVENDIDAAVIDESLYYLSDEMEIRDFISTAFVLKNHQQLHFAFKPNHQILADIFSKAIAAIGPYKTNDLKRHWFRSFDEHNIEFTHAEKTYLYSKKRFKYCIDPNWFPYEANDNGKHIGMTADILALFQQKLQISFEYLPTKSWVETMDRMKNGECDWITLAMATPQRETFLDFTEPYINVPLVIATSHDTDFIADIGILDGKSIGFIKGYAFIELISRQYPEIDIVAVDDIHQGLYMVEQGELFGFADSHSNISLHLQQHGIGKVKVSGRFDEKFELSMAVPHGDTVLLSILDKLVDSLSSQQHQAILNKYMSVSYQQVIDYSVAYQVIVIFSIVTLLILLWNRRIHSEKQKYRALVAELKEKDHKLQIAYKKLEQVSTIDKLTGIYNRRKIDEALKEELSRSQRSDSVFSIMLLDIDYFKAVNDNYGHHAGDKFLVEFAHLVSTNKRETDFFGRWGGEEFILILPNTLLQQAMHKAERLRQIIERNRFTKVGYQSVSIGVSTYQYGDDTEPLMQRADRSLYHAKAEGRNTVMGQAEFDFEVNK